MSKKVIIPILLGLVVLVAYEIKASFALFESNKVNVADTGVASWQVTVNGHDVSSTAQFTVDEISWDSSANVISDKIAPGLGGYFDIIINPSSSEVSVRYDLIFDFSNILNNEFTIVSIEEVNDQPLVLTDENTYSSVISLDDINNNVTHTVRVQLMWNNNDDNNAADTALGTIANNTIDIPVAVHLTQYLGEELTPYTGT